MELEEIKKEYYETLKRLSEASGQTIEKLDAEISEKVKNCKNIEDIMIRASEIFEDE